MAIFTITAPSGAGKSFLSHKIASYGDWSECISTTTRNMRVGEIDGKTYYFKDDKTFAQMALDGEFAESVIYNGSRYGITIAEIERVMATKKNVFIIVEYDGYQQIKNIYPDAVGIFLSMSKEDCMINMLLRGDSIKSAMERIELYDEEINNRGEFDYVVKNVRGKQYETENVIRAIIRQYSSNSFNTTPPNIGGINVKTLYIDKETCGDTTCSTNK